MVAERFVLVNLIARLWIAAIAAGLWRTLDAGDRGWLCAVLLIANLALDLAGVYLARRIGERPQSWIAADTLLSKAIYAGLFVALAAEQRLPAWLALPMVVRDVVLVLGAVCVWARTGRFPAPTGHERWPTQLFILVLAVYVAGVLWIGPALLLLFGLLLTRLPGFWLRWCMLLDPGAYQPTGVAEAQAAAEPGRSNLLAAALWRPASWLTVAALPVGMLAAAMAGVSLAKSRPGLFAIGFEPMAGLISPGDWQGLNAGNALLVYLCLLPAFLVLPGLIAVHLREVLVGLRAIQVADPRLTRSGIAAAGLATIVTAACLAAYWAFGWAVFGQSPASASDRLLGGYIGWWIFPLNGLLLSVVGLFYPSRFPHETTLERLQLSGASLSTPFIAMALGELLGLFSLKQGGVAVAAMLLFMIVMFQWRRGPSKPR